MITTVENTAVHGLIPDVVNVSVAVPKKAAGGVHVAFKVLALGAKVPPAVVDQAPPVAEPPTEPASTTDPPLQIVWDVPALAVGNGLTKNEFEIVGVDQSQIFFAFTVILYVPGALYAMGPGLTAVELLGVPPVAVHRYSEIGS